MSKVRRKGPPSGAARIPRAVSEGRQRRVIYAVVEGENTERDYLEYLVDRFAGDPRTFEIKVVWERNGLKPHDVVNRAIAELDELDDPQREQVWAFLTETNIVVLRSRTGERNPRVCEPPSPTRVSNFGSCCTLCLACLVAKRRKTFRISCARLIRRSVTSARALQHLTSGR
ncbi:hypothetical protein [Acrocarpospora sp. B8E8]|uniref:hypothetical protein n=1 Tax=Acrocarpospora sp. B8E8 TaxID=3153572 RepID=UPI00325DB41A